MKKKKLYAPAIFSAIVIGLGQIVKGDSEKGLKWLLLAYAAIPMLIYVSFTINSYLFLFLLSLTVVAYPIFWIYNILDAANSMIE